MTLLTYTLLTDPAPLEASRTGQSRSIGTVYLMATNTGRDKAYWSVNEVKVPVGDGADHLTPDITKIKATGEYHGLQSPVRKLKVQPQSGSFQVTDPAGHRIPFAPGDYLVLKLEDVPVAAAAGLAVLRVTEAASRTQNASPSTTVAAVPLVKTAKQAPAPSNFHPDKAMVDDGDKIVLRWDGPGDLGYKIRSSDGNPAPGVTTKGEWKPDPGTGPKRDTTYTLIATDPNTGRQHFLTTTVQLCNPTFETGIHASRIQGTADTGGLTFTADGVKVANNSGGQGRLLADKIEVNRVNAERVQGKNTNDGWISFPGAGVQVGHGSYNEPKLGVVYAEGGLYRRQFADGEDNSWIEIRYGALSVFHYNPDNGNSYGIIRVSNVAPHDERW
ncbi:hypothetical protein GCM10029978_061280 [Actinoallomurus acanthiterrae]